MKRTLKPSGPKPVSPKRRLKTRPAGAGSKTPFPRQRRAAGLNIKPRLQRIFATFSIAELAKICGVRRQAVEQWEDLPAHHALAVEKASGGKFSKEWLAPSFYPRPAA